MDEAHNIEDTARDSASTAPNLLDDSQLFGAQVVGEAQAREAPGFQRRYFHELLRMIEDLRDFLNSEAILSKFQDPLPENGQSLKLKLEDLSGSQMEALWLTKEKVEEMTDNIDKVKEALSSLNEDNPMSSRFYTLATSYNLVAKYIVEGTSQILNKNFLNIGLKIRIF